MRASELRSSSDGVSSGAPWKSLTEPSVVRRRAGQAPRPAARSHPATPPAGRPPGCSGFRRGSGCCGTAPVPVTFGRTGLGHRLGEDAERLPALLDIGSDQGGGVVEDDRDDISVWPSSSRLVRAAPRAVVRPKAMSSWPGPRSSPSSSGISSSRSLEPQAVKPVGAIAPQHAVHAGLIDQDLADRPDLVLDLVVEQDGVAEVAAQDDVSTGMDVGDGAGAARCSRSSCSPADLVGMSRQTVPAPRRRPRRCLVTAFLRNQSTALRCALQAPSWQSLPRMSHGAA